MKVPESVKKLFDSQSRESEGIVKDIEAHQAKWPEVKNEYDRIDAECITLAAQLTAERAAGSPRALSTEADLIALRRQRDGIRHLHQLRRDELLRAIEEITRPIISEQAERMLDLARRLPEKYQFSKSSELDARGNARGVRIQTNAEALAAARDTILDARQKLLDMRHCTLAAIEEFIRAFDRIYELLDFSVLQIEEMTPDQARDRAPKAHGTENNQTGIIVGPDPKDHIVLTNTTDSVRLDNLAKKVSKLEEHLS